MGEANIFFISIVALIYCRTEKMHALNRSM